MKLRANIADQIRLRNQARTAAVTAALARLDQLVEEEHLPEKAAGPIRRNLNGRKQRYRDRLSLLDDSMGLLRSPEQEAVVRARRAIIDAQHEELLRWRDAGRLPDSSLRVLQRELDHEERTLPNPEAG